MAEAGAEKDWLQARSDRVAAEGVLNTAEAAAKAAQARAAVLEKTIAAATRRATELGDVAEGGEAAAKRGVSPRPVG